MIRVIAALTRDKIIAVNDQLPFRLSDDLKHFKSVTKGRTVVMGRKTYDSIGFPLPGRTNVVLSRSDKPIEGCVVVSSIKEIIFLFGLDFDVIGGGEVYKMFLETELVDELILTHIRATVREGVVVHFPDEHLVKYISKNVLKVQAKNKHNEADFVISHYVKKSSIK